MASTNKASSLLDRIHSLRYLRGTNGSFQHSANAMSNRRTVRQGRQVLREIEDWMENLASPDRTEDPEFLESAFSMVQLQVAVASNAQQDHLALLELTGLLDHRDPMVNQELLEWVEGRAYLVLLGLLEMLDQVAHRVRWDHLVLLEHLA